MLISIETLVHFQCIKCNKWWSIGDAPILQKYNWFCPWCGYENILKPDITENILTIGEHL